MQIIKKNKQVFFERGGIAGDLINTKIEKIASIKNIHIKIYDFMFFSLFLSENESIIKSNIISINISQNNPKVCGILSKICI